jgi:hypothetical protein
LFGTAACTNNKNMQRICCSPSPPRMPCH